MERWNLRTSESTEKMDKKDSGGHLSGRSCTLRLVTFEGTLVDKSDLVAAKLSWLDRP